MKMVRIGLGNRIGILTLWAAVASTLAADFPARAGTITQLPPNGVSSPFAAEVDELSKSVVEVNEAIKSFQKRDFDACLEQLAKAVKAHPELPPAARLVRQAGVPEQSDRTGPSRPGAGGRRGPGSSRGLSSSSATWPCSRAG